MLLMTKEGCSQSSAHTYLAVVEYTELLMPPLPTTTSMSAVHLSEWLIEDALADRQVAACQQL